jgi:hypothetical protein
MKTVKSMVCKGLFMVVLALQVSCGGKSQTLAEKKDSEPVANQTATDEGFIKELHYVLYQGITGYGLKLDNGNWYDFSPNYHYQRGEDDILNPAKDDANKLNTLYLGKKVKIAYETKYKTITSLTILGDPMTLPPNSLTYNAYLTKFENDKHWYPHLTFRTDKGEEKTIRMYIDDDNHFTVSAVYNMSNKKEDCVFRNKDFGIALITGNEHRLASVLVENKLIKVKEVDPVDQAKTTRFFYDYVVKDVVWGPNAFELPAEQQD